jgi:hypothetical protein
MMPSAIQEPVWRPFAFAEQPSQASLEAMGFDVRRLGFYAWLVTHGREPLLDGEIRISTPRFGEAISQ